MIKTVIRPPDDKREVIMFCWWTSLKPSRLISPRRWSGAPWNVMLPVVRSWISHEKLTQKFSHLSPRGRGGAKTKFGLEALDIGCPIAQSTLRRSGFERKQHGLESKTCVRRLFHVFQFILVYFSASIFSLNTSESPRGCGWKLLLEHWWTPSPPAPLGRFCDSGAAYKCYDLLCDSIRSLTPDAARVQTTGHAYTPERQSRW